jgi:16S rRNA (cytidine1402-2'-O)-methyltransferase
LSASGLPTDRFVFEGFLPAKAQERATRLSATREETRSMVFYEAPHRLKESLNDMRRLLGNREIVIGREMTKVHEEFLRGTIDEVLEALADREIKGEVTVVVRGASSPAAVSQEEVETEIRRLADEGLGLKQISAIVSARFQVAKREVYQLALRLRGAPEKR